MLSLVRHFGTISLTHDAQEPDYTFFNPLGTRLVLYNAGWNVVLNILAGALLLVAVVRARRQGHVRLRGLLGGALAWLGALVFVLALGWASQRLVWAAYPQYAAFYDHTFYNVAAYHLALVALGAVGVATRQRNRAEHGEERLGPLRDVVHQDPPPQPSHALALLVEVHLDG